MPKSVMNKTKVLIEPRNSGETRDDRVFVSGKEAKVRVRAEEKGSHAA